MQTFVAHPTFEGVEAAAIALSEVLARDLDGFLVNKIQIAVVEALNNIVVHGLGAMGPPIELALNLPADGSDVVVTIADTGPAFNQGKSLPDREPDGPSDAWSESGRGLMLIRQCTDALYYQRHEDRNVLSLHFKQEEN